MTATQKELHRLWEETYQDVMALYATLRDSNNIEVRRTRMVMGEAIAEPIDFLCDVDLKAQRAFSSPVRPATANISLWTMVRNDPESYMNLPIVLRRWLGEYFVNHNLGTDGDYKTLYFRTKNQRPVQTREETNEQYS
jgi:hypothetical protein